MAADNDVRKASEQFYAALNSMLNGDPAPLSKIWSHGSAVTTMHPIGGREVGWEQVKGSWEQVAKLAKDGKVQLEDRHIHVSGDTAYEVGMETGTFSLAGKPVKARHRVTNIYHREADGWKVVHHHTDLVPSMQDIIKNL